MMMIDIIVHTYIHIHTIYYKNNQTSGLSRITNVLFIFRFVMDTDYLQLCLEHIDISDFCVIKRTVIIFIIFFLGITCINRSTITVYTKS